jgi:hypothetical protein
LTSQGYLPINRMHTSSIIPLSMPWVAAIDASLEFLTLGRSLYILFYSWGIGWNPCLVCAS